MSFLRWMPPLLALFSISVTGCPGNSASNEPKPVPSPEVSVSLAGVDTSSLTPRERREWAAQVSELLSPCPDTPVSIAQCVKEQRPCKACLPAAQLLLKQVKEGRSKKEREDAFHMRFDANKVRTLATDGSPDMGPPEAPVTIVEWADFECPFCRLMSPVLEELVKRFDGQVRLVFKFYPLSAHVHGEPAARAAVAALNQGKFWEMHHLLFENQERLEQADIERYAQRLKLDPVKFRADLVSTETKSRIDKDRKQADEVGLEGTPLVFINGREVNLQLLTNPPEDLEEWVKVELELLGQTPRPAPPKPVGAPPGATDAPASASATPAASGTPAASATPAAGSGSAPAAGSGAARPAPSAGPAQPAQPRKP
ncbi:thioredoxin domain-containing protein [Sorangium sp. So ce291]|uniref:DsbA family protein n=1 Tax=Sorangium sp. So ce291 TaxID=3133294 RepID=UPI003F6479EE